MNNLAHSHEVLADKVPKNLMETLIGKAREYEIIPMETFKGGHGNGLSVKIVVPCFCQAKCQFCFNNLTINTQRHNYETFFKNLKISLDRIFGSLGERRNISLDITGNEPTFDVNVFKRLMHILHEYKGKAKKIVLTTNGFHLAECLSEMTGIVDIVNISLHHWDEDIRKKEVLKTDAIPSNEALKSIIEVGNSNGISFTAVAVLYKKFERFIDFYNKFVDFAIATGFDNVRFRSNFIDKDEFTNEVLNTDIDHQEVDAHRSLTTKVIKDSARNGYEARILVGVPDLTAYLVGWELVIDDDGKTYIDYNKRFPIDDSTIGYFNNLYILK